MKSYQVYFESAHLRCTLNTVSSAMIYRYLLENGHQITHEISHADFIIINSCGYHQDLRDASVALYQKFHALKKKNATIIMFGCLVKIDEERLRSLELIPVHFSDGQLLDRYFSQTKKFEQMTPSCDSRTRNTLIQNLGRSDFSHQPPFFLTHLLRPFSQKIQKNYERLTSEIDHCNKILVQISTGCLGNCSYCVIKIAKGTLHSRPIDTIISDIASIYDPSKTLILVADDCSCYGLEIGTNLFELIQRIQQDFPGLSIQINYISPNFLVKFHDQYRDLFRQFYLPYITIPFQSGSNKIIHAMNRRYDTQEVVEIVKEIKQVSPQTLIEGHFIVGYPGETFLDFLKTLFTIQYFDYPIAVMYSDATGVKSTTLPHQKSYLIKYARYLIISLFINFVICYKLFTKPA